MRLSDTVHLQWCLKDDGICMFLEDRPYRSIEM